jgi:hypothetical protein
VVPMVAARSGSVLWLSVEDGVENMILGLGFLWDEYVESTRQINKPW